LNLSKVTLFIFTIVSVATTGCADSENAVGDSVGRNGAEMAQTALEELPKSSTEDQEKPSKDEVLGQFQNTMDLKIIKQAYSDYTREEVKLLQKQLNSNGYDSGDVDGYIGEVTIKAVASYQYDQGFNVTGILTESEVESLGIVEAMDIKVTLLSVKLDYNNSVGNEWGYSFFANEEEINSGRSISLPLAKGDSLQLEAYATEFDKVPDNGSDSLSYSYSELKNNSSFTANMNVVVSENRGRYSGNTASWVFSYKIVASSTNSIE